MSNSSENPEEIFKGLILDSLEMDGFKLWPQISEILSRSFSSIAALIPVVGLGVGVADSFAELKDFVSIKKEYEENSLRTKVIFDMKYQFLDSKDNEKLKSFLRGFELARQMFKDSIKHFEFLFDVNDKKFLEGSKSLHKLLTVTYGNEHVILEQSNSLLKENNIFISRNINNIILLL
ncbi:6632_t:CDS:2 [Funneliformis caledonium]|uniref:6632_t:CDS:1 n=1 Tax=Funneliformis caledonium TaxID=1117310 RepID=A0A9N8WFL8_9GLOM|nr:6632_t:CDS:2 [Funneliformis caledonium]